jgi:hypothetical protein
MLIWSVQSGQASMRANGECPLHQVHILEVGIFCHLTEVSVVTVKELEVTPEC